MSNTSSAQASLTSLATLSSEEFKKVWEAQRARPNARLSLALGSKWVHAKTNAIVTLVRLTPKARSCAFFADATGALMYLKIDRDVTPAPTAAPAKPAK